MINCRLDYGNIGGKNVLMGGFVHGAITIFCAWKLLMNGFVDGCVCW